MPAMEDWIMNYYASSAFNQCNRQPWPKITGKPMKFHTKPDVKPYYCRKPAVVPIHFREQVRNDLEADVKKGVLERVPAGESMEWCTRMVVQTKKNGTARRTVDLSYLSRHGLPEPHHTRSAPMIAKSVPAGKLKTVLDCKDGYHGIEIDADDRKKTAFATEWGCYRYRRAPQGYLSSGDTYGRHTDAVIEECPGAPAIRDWEKIVDDTIVWSDNVEAAFHRTCALLSHCSKNGIVFSSKKFKFARKSVEFAGFLITDAGIKPALKYTESITNFPSPSCISDVRAWYGLINQVAFCFCKTPVMAPFRHLLQKDTPFLWTQELENAFVASKGHILQLINEGVYSFDPELATCLSTDFSKVGTGYLLQQKTCKCEEIKPTCCSEGWRLVLAGGKFCNKAESNYAPIEGEALGVLRALRDTRYYTLGCKNLYVATDHRPLVPILNNKHLAEIENPRLLKICEKLLWWSFTALWCPGKKNVTADTMSRVRPPVGIGMARCDSNDDDNFICKAVVFNVSMDLEVLTWEKVVDATQQDPDFVKLIEIVDRGFPATSYEMPKELREFFQFRNELHSVDGALCFKDRIVIPRSLRESILSSAHAAHQGVTGMTSRLNASVFWPGIHGDIVKRRQACMTCTNISPSQSALPPTAPPTPAFPFQSIVADYFSLQGHNYLVIADRFSGWMNIYSCPPGEFDTDAFITSLRDFVMTFNLPEELTTDGGPQYKSGKLKECLSRWGVHHRVGSAYFPHSNSRSEIAVKASKRLLRDNLNSRGQLNTDKFMRAVMQYKNTPQQDTMRSPAQMVYGRQLRDFIPSLQHKYEYMDDWRMSQELRERMLAKQRTKDNEKWTVRTKELPDLLIGTAVSIQNQTGPDPKKWDKTGIVVENRPNSQVLIKVDGSRRLTIRNRQFVRKLNHGRRDTKKPSLIDDAMMGAPLDGANTDDPKTPEVVDINDPGEEADHDPGLDPNSVLDVGPETITRVDEVDDQGGGGDVDEVEPEGDEQALGRPRRTRKPNTRYSASDYDLS